MQAAESYHHHALLSPPAATEWCRLLLHVICSVQCMPYNALSMGMTQQFFRFCSWWPWHSNSSNRGTTHALRVNLVRIWDIWVWQNEKQKSQTVLKTEPYLRAVIIFTERKRYDVLMHIKGVFDYRVQIWIHRESGFRFTWQIEWL